MRDIMIRAHEIARTMEGDYAARMSFALRQAWREAKVANEALYELNDRGNIVVRMEDRGVTVVLRPNRWTRGNHDRLYMNEVRNGRASRFCHVDLNTGKVAWDIPYTNPSLFSFVEK